MAALPEKYISSNENPCAYTDDSRRLISCSFSDFINDEGQPLGQNELIVDALTYDVSALNYLPKGITDSCNLEAASDADELQHDIFKANVLLELIAESEAGTKSLLKPLYTNWDYLGVFFLSDEDDDDDENLELLSPLDLATSAFYQESLTEDPDRKYRLHVRSPCQMDVNRLNENMHLTVYGRRK
jgi:hypothetical protein